jgi:hypothetical protein
MSQNIQDFYRVATARDFARKFQFRVLQLGNTNFNENALVYLESASLPGRTITNQTVPFMGLNFNVPGTVTYPNSNNYTVTFRCDQNYDIRTVLEASTFGVFNELGTEGNPGSFGDYRIPDASSLITLELLDKSLNPVRVYNLVGAYVVSVGEMQYNLGDTGTVQTVQANLAYQYWQVVAGAGAV